MENLTQGVLFLVATPIGNLSDISARAVQTLENADFIAAEDTRVTLKLLGHLGIKKQLVSYFEHNRRESGEKILTRLLGGESCALVSDAGTPAISDPGEDLVRLCADSGISIISIPGPCAAISALCMSGLKSGRFTFEGFLSTSRKSRFEHLAELKAERRTMIFYEAPHKLLRTLKDMLEVFGDRSVSISREMTKIYETTLRFPLSEAVAYFSENTPRGEFVLVIEGAVLETFASLTQAQMLELAEKYVNAGMSVRDAAKTVSDETGISKNAIYNAIINAKCVEV